ncbi:MAG: hypothetical protein QXV37_01580 [Candidatus Jordarchaeaceae archaeon]
MDKATTRVILKQLKDVYDTLTEDKREDVRKYRYTLAYTIANIRIDEITT